jgi:hypothetical protein
LASVVTSTKAVPLPLDREMEVGFTSRRLAVEDLEEEVDDVVEDVETRPVWEIETLCSFAPLTVFTKNDVLRALVVEFDVHVTVITFPLLDTEQIEDV